MKDGAPAGVKIYVVPIAGHTVFASCAEAVLFVLVLVFTSLKLVADETIPTVAPINAVPVLAP